MIALRHPTLFPATSPSDTGLIATFDRWLERRRQRRALLVLDDKLLKDIGLSAADAWHEAHKPFWRP